MMQSIANEETLHRVSDTQDAFLDEDIQTIMKAFQDERNEQHHIGLEKINDEQVKLNDTMAQASKTEAMIREDTRLRIQKIYSERSFETESLKHGMVGDDDHYY